MWERDIVCERERHRVRVCVCVDASALLTVHVTGVTGDVTVLIVYLTYFS